MQKSCMWWVHEIPSLLKHINTSSGNYVEKAKPPNSCSELVDQEDCNCNKEFNYNLDCDRSNKCTKIITCLKMNLYVQPRSTSETRRVGPDD